jgi:hypothetical protein
MPGLFSFMGGKYRNLLEIVPKKRFRAALHAALDQASLSVETEEDFDNPATLSDARA